MRSKYFFILITLYFLGEPKIGSSQKRDKDDRLHGKHLFHYDKEKTQPWMQGRFRHGNEVGKWLKWDMEGNLEEIKHYRKNKIKVKIYHTNGNLNWKGNAKLEITDEKLRYFWQGPWKRYDENGKYVETILYSNGLQEGETIEN